MMGSTAGSDVWKSLVEVEGGVDLGLAAEQFLQMRFVLERPVGPAVSVFPAVWI
jgi:hypothetical protein